MTDKEKAWAYDGALNRAKAAIDNAADKDLVKGIVKTIFPLLREGQENNVIDIPFGAHDSELKGWEYTIPEGFTAEIKDGKVIVREKESEDERIIEKIKFAVLQMKTTREDTRQRCLAWLEKQKENPKSADSIPSDCASDAKCEDRDSNYGVFPEDVIVVARACEKLETHGYPELAYALKNVNLYTKEQKPVDYDHEMWKNCVANFEGGKKEVIEHPEKYGLQKPAEWSEEDENNIGWIVAFLQGEEGSGEVIELMRESLISWLKSLRPQYHGDVTMTEAYKMGLEAGKASSWKPSKEQMVALYYASYGGELEPDELLLLNSLYEQLEKLIRYGQDRKDTSKD